MHERSPLSILLLLSFLLLFLPAFLTSACQGPTPSPSFSEPSTRPLSPLGRPTATGETGRSSTPMVLSPQAHLPVIGQWNKPEPEATATALPVPTPFPTQSSTPVASPTPAPTFLRRQHMPLILGSEAPRRQEPLPEPGGPPSIGVLLDMSAQAGRVLPGRSLTPWQMFESVLPSFLAAWSENIQILPLALGGRAFVCEENVRQFPRPSGTVLDRQAFWTQQLSTLSPAGPAPLSEALLRLTATFPPKGRRSILVLTSGGPTCGEDPCNTARVLERAENDVTLHVVAMELPAGQVGAWRCLAEETGGTFREVKGEGELRSALQDAFRQALGGQIRVEVLGANDHPLFPTIMVSQDGHPVSTFDAWTDADLAAGTYTVEVGTALPLVFPTVTITRGERTRLRIPLGELDVYLLDPAGSPVAGEITVWDQRHGPFFTVVDKEARIPLPTGHYTVSARVPAWKTPLAYARDVPVVVNHVQERVLTLPVGRLDVHLRRQGQPVSAFVAVAPRFNPTVPLAAGWANGDIRFTLPWGTYHLTLSHYAEEGSILQLREVGIPAGDVLPVNIELTSGWLTVAAADRSGNTLAGHVSIFPAGRTSPVVAAGETGQTFHLPVGTYDVRIDADEGYPLWAWDVDVHAGETRLLQILRPQARLWVRVKSPLAHPVPAFVNVRHPGETDVVTSGWAPGRWILPPGIYMLSADEYASSGTQTQGSPFVLQAGDIVTRVLSLPLAELRIVPTEVDRVTVEVYSAGETTAPLTRVTDSLPILRLPPGTYDVHVVAEGVQKRSRWVTGITLVAGEEKVVRVAWAP